jgi:hypothetical protein
LIQRKSQPLRISQDSTRIQGADMKFTHIHTFIPYPEHQLFMAAAALVQESGGPVALHAFKKEGDGDSGETAPGQELDLSRLRFTP